MLGLGRQAVILATAKLGNYALMFVTPIFLVRLLSVEEFGRYREFMLYGSMLQWMAAFAVNDSLLYFVPLHSASMWRVVKQSVTLTACSSCAVLAVVTVLDVSFGGALIGRYLVPVVLYVLLMVNLDFWESLFVASHKPIAMLSYSATRIGLRMLIAVGAAAISGNVAVIIWSLILFEGVRMAVSAVAWRIVDRSASEPPFKDAWRAQLRFCVPAGITVLLIMINRNLSNLAVAKVLGAVALAYYTIGTYVEPLGTLTSAISTVLLPEMVRRGNQEGGDPLRLWQRACVVNCIIIFPIVVLLFRYADVIVDFVFGAKYAAAVPVFRIFLIFIVRNCFDFAPPLRAINNTRPLVVCNVLALIVSAVGLWLLMPRMGLSGAVTAFVLSSLVEPIYLGTCIVRKYNVRLRDLLPWASISKVAFAALSTTLLILSSIWTQFLGLVGVVFAGTAYLVAFIVVLRMSGVAEMEALWGRATEMIARTRRART